MLTDMPLHPCREKMSMHFKLLSEKILTVVLLLLGLEILRSAVIIILPFILPTDNMDVYTFVISYSPWIAQIIFALVIYRVARQKGIVAISIGILSTVYPLYGSIFYIITTLKIDDGNG
jgi:hypothetical protein